MATTVLADVVQQDQYAREMVHTSLRKSVFVNNGVVVPDRNLTQMLMANVGNDFRFDYFKDLQRTEARVGSDAQTAATPENIVAQSDRAVGSLRNQSWGEMNITSNLSGAGSPIGTIAGLVGSYWADQYDLQTIAAIDGVLADNVITDSSDMYNDQNQVAITIQLILNTKQTAGDMRDMFTAIICHSAIVTKLQIDGVTNSVYSDSGSYLYESLAGLRIIESDAVTTVAGTKLDYTSYLVGAGAVGFGEGVAKNANSVDFQEAKGNGQGEESLWSRKNYSLHPYGFDWLGASVAGVSPTNAEVAAAANWARNADRKRVKIAALLCSAA